MNKRLIAFLSILSLSLLLPLIPAHSATKAGAKCTKLGITSVAGNKTFTCIKSGKKSVWSKGVSKSTVTAPVDIPISIDNLDLNELSNREKIELIGQLLPFCTPKYMSIIDQAKPEPNQINPIEINL